MNGTDAWTMLAEMTAPDYLQPLIGLALVAIVLAAVWAVARPRYKCRACREEIDPKATVCPHCGTEAP